MAGIKVPPLRERKADIPLLVEYILRKINQELGKRLRKVEEGALRKMMEYDWPGNVRELTNVLTHVAINTQGEVILEEHIDPLLGRNVPVYLHPKETHPKEQSLKDMEKEYIIGTLQRTHWHLGKTCELLGISRPTLRQKLKTYGLDFSAMGPCHEPS